LPAPQKLETLDDLLAEAGRYAEFCMRHGGTMPPTLFLIAGDAGPLMFVPASLTDEAEKDAFATLARLMCIAHDASAVVTALEAWMTVAKPGEKLDLTERPAEAFDRQEVVILCGESRGFGQKQQFLPIIRSGNGKFFGFDPTTPNFEHMEGRFAQILPPKTASIENRVLAQAMLKFKKVKTIRLTPPRRR
jgi:hypothetical protein